MKHLFYISIFLCCIQASIAQTTFDRIHQILQTNCAASCHNQSNLTGNLDLSGTKQDVLNALVNVTPDNNVAATKGFKRVVPGDARKSFLFHKVNQGLDVNISLQTGEGDPMPQGQSALTQVERELIRQWIIFGAEDTGYHMVRENVITSYYNGFAEQREPATPVPNPSVGYQLYYGPIFLQPGEEVEFDNKFPLYNTQNLEVYKLDMEVNKESHHMAIFKFKPGQAATVPDGLRRVNGVGDAAALFFSSEVVAQWPNSTEIELPNNTALFWDSNTTLTMSYHILNYSDSIIAAEAYLNVYSRPRQSTTVEMTSYPVRYDGHEQYQGGWDVQNLVILPTGTDTTFTINQYHQDSIHYWNIWSIQAHTHALGKDYNVYFRNEDGSKGTLIYEGKRNDQCQFSTGFYQWEHPPLCYYGQLYSVDMTKGLIHEAVFRNNGPDTVGFGLKTTDEMFVSYMFYYKSELPVSVSPSKTLQAMVVNVFPNPATNNIHIELNAELEVKNATIEIFDIVGKKVVAKKLITNKETLNISSLPSGNYAYRIFNHNTPTVTGRIMIE
jgi:hypothetical protein